MSHSDGIYRSSKWCHTSDCSESLLCVCREIWKNEVNEPRQLLRCLFAYNKYNLRRSLIENEILKSELNSLNLEFNSFNIIMLCEADTLNFRGSIENSCFAFWIKGHGLRPLFRQSKILIPRSNQIIAKWLRLRGYSGNCVLARFLHTVKPIKFRNCLHSTQTQFDTIGKTPNG